MQCVSILVLAACAALGCAFAFGDEQPQAFAFRGANGADIAGRMFAFTDSRGKRADPQRFAFGDGRPANDAKFAFAFAKRSADDEAFLRFARAQQRFAFNDAGARKFA